MLYRLKMRVIEKYIQDIIFQKVEIKNMIDENNVMIDEKNFFNQPIKNKVKTYGNIRKNSASQGHYYIYF